MSFTYDVNENRVIIGQEDLSQCFEKIAASSNPRIFADFVAKFQLSVQKVFNQIAAQVIETDDKDLITLFRRAVRNADTLFPANQINPIPLYNKHYQKPPFLISNIDLILDVQENHVNVTTDLQVIRSSNHDALILDAKQHKVLEIIVNHIPLTSEFYKVTEHEIIINLIPQDKEFHVKVISEINPFDNNSGQGLYPCGKWLTTQCESEGARCIFPTLDRPDVLSVYSTTIIADTNKYPCRISNGNFLGEEVRDDGRMSITWQDPFPKPSYLFAAVLGEFGILEDTFTTRSGREVTLEVYMEKGKENRAKFSLLALKNAMKYEEDYFDREYDLDCLKMVAMPKFNARAMENKGLIIFNESCILVDETCASDMDYFWVDLVISHEYCHNWSGNRETVRNWFELALKEAFTDFRCSQYMQWKYGAELVRPYEAKALREGQFPEDAHASAHPIQVESYVTSDEIYDSTTYVKGREIFRMLKTILDSKSEGGFRIAQNAYFDRYDGQAVTFNELLETLQEVSGVDLTQFRRWFHQPGTPTVHVRTYYKKENTFCIDFEQSCPHPKTGKEQLPFHIPLYVEILDRLGGVMVPKQLVELKNEGMVFTFDNIRSGAIPVFHHDFTAPIRVEYPYVTAQLETIIQFEKDAFARKEAGDLYLKMALSHAYEVIDSLDEYVIPKNILDFYAKALASDEMTPLAKAELLDLPSIRSMVEKHHRFDFVTANKARNAFKKGLADSLQIEQILVDILARIPDPETYEPDSVHFKDEIAIRKLRNNCYKYLALVSDGLYNTMIIRDYHKVTNFNNRMALLDIIIEMDDPRKEEILKAFYEKWKNDGTILCNWIDVQTAASNCTVKTLDQIFHTEGFLKDNPDHMRSLIRTFVNNLAAYHGKANETYAYVTDRILEFGKINPKVASNYLAENAFKDYSKLPNDLKALMKEQLERLADPSVCLELRSVADKYLKD